MAVSRRKNFEQPPYVSILVCKALGRFMTNPLGSSAKKLPVVGWPFQGSQIQRSFVANGTEMTMEDDEGPGTKSSVFIVGVVGFFFAAVI